MTTKELFAAFADSHRWNALVQIAYKLSFALLSFTLYRTLTASDYSTWAITNSAIFLVLLWADFGLRKTIPRYAPRFASSPKQMRRFIVGVTTAQTTLITLAIGPLLWLLNRWLTGTPHGAMIFPIACAVFAIESIISVLRLLHHAHFWIKQFNQVAAIGAIVETTIDLLVIWFATTSSPSGAASGSAGLSSASSGSADSITILSGVLLTKVTVGAAVSIATGIMLHRLVKQSPEQKRQHAPPSIQELLKHTSAMWVTSGLKSLSERNFMLLFFTNTLGAEVANLFKVANDAALVFYRLIIKTIGTTDTALLAHIDAAGWQKNLVMRAFEKLTVRVACLALPLFGIAILGMIGCRNLCLDSMVLHAFTIMVIAYLMEVVLLPYERILEVKRSYGSLTRAYIPYVIGLLALMTGKVVTSIGLLGTLLCIHIVRLVSLWLMSRTVQRTYHLHLPHNRIALFSKAIIYGSLLIIILVLL